MEKHNRLPTAYLEFLSEEEYGRLKGCLVRVCALNGYANDAMSDTFLPDMTGKPVIVRIDEASVRDDLHRWMDEWLDPAYPVTVVDHGDLPKDLHSCWIYGNCRSLDGGFEPGDIWAVVKPVCNLPPIEKPLDIQKIAERLGGEVREPPPRYRHLVPPRSACGPSGKTTEYVQERKRTFLPFHEERLGNLERRVKVLEEALGIWPKDELESEEGHVV